MDHVLAELRRRANARLINRLSLVKGDITRQADVDAIVSVIPRDLEITGSLNKSLIAAAGQELDDFILEHLYKPHPGDAYVIPGFALPVKHIIFVIRPVWRSSIDREDSHLIRSYRSAIETAQRKNFTKIAFPPLFTGSNGLPPERAVRLAMQSICDRLINLNEVRIVCNRDDIYNVFEMRLRKLGWQGYRETPGAEA